MSVTILKSGIQTTIQSRPRSGKRHLGVPDSGAADPLSMALANRLVGNDLLAPALEVSLSGLALRFESDTTIAVTGANAKLALAGRAVSLHKTLGATAGDELRVGAAEQGARVYIAFSGGLDGEEILGSVSTYIPAALGGYQGRALAKGDRLRIKAAEHESPILETPQEFQPHMVTSWAIRACNAGESGRLRNSEQLFDTNFVVAARCDRMGMMLEGRRLSIDSDGRMPSAPVFPGTVQCPEDGRPFVLSVDAQTTGGYPRVAQIARADRHQLGQLRPGDHVRLLWRDEQSAIDELRAKIDYWCEWLNGVEQVI
jgi:allophanate hydrolase